MPMTNNEYRRRVFMTLSQKPAREALRRVSPNVRQVNIMHAVIGVNTEVGETIKGLLNYVTGASQLQPTMQKNAFEEMGDTLYYIMVLSKMLKVKLPSLGKKLKLKDKTLTSSLLTMSVLSTEMLDLVKKTFYGVETINVPIPGGMKKVRVSVPGGGFELVEKMVPEHVVSQYNKKGQLEVFEARNAKIAALLTELVAEFWPVCFTLFGVPPAVVAAGNSAKLAERYPDGFFDKKAQEVRDEETELAAMEDGASK